MTCKYVAALQRSILARKIFIPYGSKEALPLPRMIQSAKNADEDIALPEGVEELVLWQDEDETRKREGKLLPTVKVDNMLTRWLRPHQREGVSFLYECVMGLRGFEGSGCILADDMGLGKTLQAISLMWTLLNSGITENGEPTVKRVVIVCPTSLVANWDAECIKWLKGKVKTTPICGDSKADAQSAIKMFLAPNSRSQVLIVSYETFRIYSDKFMTESSCQLVVCDEAHRLKNGETLTNQALAKMSCKRRVMLSGTPMQNHLDEFYSMVSFCNPGILGTPKDFGKKFERPILAGREPDATDAELAKASAQNEMLSVIVNKFILRRTNTILSKHLPPKVIEIVCCKLTSMQRSIYEHMLSEKQKMVEKSGKQMDVLALITALKKLCNHPKLIFDALREKKYSGKTEGGSVIGEDLAPYFNGMYDGGGSGRGGRGGSTMCDGWEWHGGKFAVLGRLLHHLRKETTDRIVIISNYTQTLDLVEQLCRQNNYPSLRLDGGTSINKRQKLVDQFNDLSNNQFVFLLSSKAGGCGINLVGGNRLVLFDPDWNPANDKQAAARCWRDGQKKKCYEYRFLSSGTIDEKIFQRQLAKQALTSVVDGRGQGLEQMSMTTEDLQQLFLLDMECPSDTHRTCDCTRCPDLDRKCVKASDAMNNSSISSEDDASGKILPEETQLEDFDEAKLSTWAHHYRMEHVPDLQLRKAAGEDVSFVFSLEVDGKRISEMAERADEKSKKAATLVAQKKALKVLADEDVEEEEEEDASSSSSDEEEQEEEEKTEEDEELIITTTTTANAAEEKKKKALKDVSVNVEMSEKAKTATVVAKKKPPPPPKARTENKMMGRKTTKRRQVSIGGDDDGNKSYENEEEEEEEVPPANTTKENRKNVLTKNKKKPRVMLEYSKEGAENIVCHNCKRGDDDALIVLCDTCNRGFHYFCNDPPLPGVPKGGFWCSDCKMSSEEQEEKNETMEVDPPRDSKKAKKEQRKKPPPPPEIVTIESDDEEEEEEDEPIPESENEEDSEEEQESEKEFAKHWNEGETESDQEDSLDSEVPDSESE